MTARERYERLENDSLSALALKSSRSRGREKAEAECDTRTCYQRDVDRITYCKAFRRLMHKTQVFLKPEGDHYRTRMTHTLEVSRIARTISRALGLNEDATEAIALGHDLGHTPFGHAGEGALNSIVPFGFTHNAQSLRVVKLLERNGAGLNLTLEVCDGIAHHTGDLQPFTQEGLVVRKADRIAYINHDIDDAERAGILKSIPEHLRKCLGENHQQRVNAMVTDLISRKEPEFSSAMGQAADELREFMFESVYRNPVAKGEEERAKDIVRRMYEFFSTHPERIPPEFAFVLENEGSERAACDYVAGMTDRYAVNKYTELFVPRGWSG